MSKTLKHPNTFPAPTTKYPSAPRDRGELQRGTGRRRSHPHRQRSHRLSKHQHQGVLPRRNVLPWRETLAVGPCINATNFTEASFKCFNSNTVGHNVFSCSGRGDPLTLITFESSDSLLRAVVRGIFKV